MSRKEHINITLDPTNLRWIDMIRGQEPRSTFIDHVVSVIRVRSKNVFDWEAEVLKAEEDIRKGKVFKFTDTKKAIKWLKS